MSGGLWPRTDFVHLHDRYGITPPERVAQWCALGPEDPEEQRWRHRHIIDFHREPEWLLRCVCPGFDQRRGCMEKASQEDRLCDPCREHCWGARPDGTQMRAVTAYGEMDYRP